MNLIDVADPMCSWCYGFGKTLSDLQGAPVELLRQSLATVAALPH